MIADILLEAKRPQQALAEYQTDLKLNPNRFDGLYGAARAAEAAGKQSDATEYYALLLKVCDGSNSTRPRVESGEEIGGAEITSDGSNPERGRVTPCTRAPPAALHSAAISDLEMTQGALPPKHCT